MPRFYSKGFLGNVTIEELTPWLRLHNRLSLLLQIIAVFIRKVFLLARNTKMEIIPF
jgi:hypothetical protein